tara:strand:+ start:405 stop:593 length:189 start_codon:yes stop_codon:yes gene_type:complete
MPDLLDAEDKERINYALGEIDGVEENILRAKEAGLDVSQQERRLGELKTQLQRIKGAFFGGG